MRLTKGSKVEVLIHKDASTGACAWRCAEVISGNGRMYVVQYSQFRTSNKAVEEERVPRGAIRPHPPPVFGIDSWVTGDLLEFFHDDSWKTAIFLKHMGDNNFSVRLLGSPNVFKAHRSHLRIPQCWENGDWSVAGCSGFIYSTVEDQKCYVISSGTLKRGPPLDFSCVEEYEVPAKRLRTSRKDFGQLQTYGYQSHVCGKVDTFVPPHKISGENVVLYPSNTKSNGIFNAHTGSTSDNSFAKPTLSIDAISCASSVGSCSAEENELCNLYNGCIRDDTNRVEDYSSDADSSSACEYKKRFSVPRVSKAESHMAAICKYRRFVEALYAAGSLSWEQEERMMDLRCSLNISDNEHLRIEFLRAPPHGRIRGLYTLLLKVCRE